jgi:thymidine kinase
MIGKLSVICGPMFSGKTDEMIRRLRRAKIANHLIFCFKPVIDNRYGATNTLASHSHAFFASTPIKTSSDIERVMSEVKEKALIGIDEVQFIDDKIVTVVLDLLEKGQDIIVSGLDLDFKRRPFQITATLLAHAEKVSKFSAICVKCNADATKTYRKDHNNEEVISVGGIDMYEARCTSCHAKAD